MKLLKINIANIKYSYEWSLRFTVKKKINKILSAAQWTLYAIICIRRKEVYILTFWIGIKYFGQKTQEADAFVTFGKNGVVGKQGKEVGIY